LQTSTTTATRVRLPNRWRPRDYQDALWTYLEHGGLRADVAAHRRWGKDEVALHHAAAQAHRRVGVYWHMLPEAGQARKAIWNAVNPHTGRKRIDEAFPRSLRKSTRASEMLIEFNNGSVWQVVGSDNYDSLVGSSPVGVVFSEWALAKPDAWTYIRPILAENGGWALFLWTPRGRNHATRSFEARAADPAWFTLRSPATGTDVFTPDQLAKERADLIAETGSAEEGEARFSTEYLVDFDAATPGAYYGTVLRDAAEAGRICRVPHDPALKVDTAWDLGIDDYTAVWFFQQVGREVRAIDYFETSGEGLQSIVREAIAGKPYVYGRHYLPHDVMVRELGAAGRSRFETLAGLGVSPIEVGTAAEPEDRINAARQMIPITWFDAERCAVGLDRLRGYRKRWSGATRSYVGPLHDKASHGADAFGEFAVNRRGTAAASAPRSRAADAQGWMG
jgi:phage terminase large subunit